MGVSEENLKVVKLTKFKKMPSTSDLVGTLKSTDEPYSVATHIQGAEVSGSSMAGNFTETAQSLSEDEEVPLENKSLQKNPPCSCERAPESGHKVEPSCLGCSQGLEMPKKGRTRRKSWCVESSLKKQFNRDSELRRTVERSEGLPPVLESRASSPAFVSSPSRLAGAIDQRLRRLRLASKAMTLAIPSERRSRPSIFDSGRRKSEAVIPLTLAGLKARRKSGGTLNFDGLRAFPERLKTPNTRSALDISSDRHAPRSCPLPDRKRLDSNHHASDSCLSPPLALRHPKNNTIQSRKSATALGVWSWPPFGKEERTSEGLVQEILSFNSRNILESVTTSRKIGAPILSFDEPDASKFESDKSLSLLQEEDRVEMCSETSDETQELSKDLRRHISSFADRLHLTKDRLEDTAKCYRLLDKAYAWALEAMKVEGRVKSSGAATREQVAAAADAIGELLQEGPPVSEETFAAMLDLATRLDNQTLLQQCKMADSRCRETISLLRSRQAALLKARHQMEFDCQAFVDLNDILSLSEEQFPPSSASFPTMPFNGSGRRRSGCSVGSRSRDPLSRCSSLETDDDSVFAELPFSSTPNKNTLDGKSSLRGIKELRESHEDLVETGGFVRSNCNFFRSSLDSDFRLNSDLPPLASCPSTINTISSSTIRAFSSGSSSSCSSSDSSGPTSRNKKAIWRFAETGRRTLEESNEVLDDSILRLSSINPRASLPSEANSHLLMRGSQINLSNSEDLTQEEVKKNKTLLLIMEELIRTERDYVYYLEYIIENYIPELLREDIPQALRGQRNVIFGNIEKIYEFHSGYFLKALESCNTKPFSVGSVFLRYENQFYLYALYNKNKPKSDELMADFGSSFFKAKQTALGDKMDLSSYLLKPFQRMGKYALLLKQLLKECSKTEEGYEELAAAQEMVQFQLRHGNDLLAMDSLRDSDVNLKEQGRLLRQGEFLVMEGSRGKKSLRHVFLFEDLILFSKGRRDPEKKTLDIFQYKQSLKTTDIGLTAQVGESALRFEIWFRKRKPSDTFLFQAPSTEVKEAWTEEISKLLWRQALKNRKLRLHEMSSMGIGNKPCLDIRPSEDQINDRSVCITKAPTRMKLAVSTSLTDATTSVRRPHSVISVSSSASSAESSTHSSSAGPSFVGTLNLGFESGDSPKPLQRSVTRTSQCSAESGIITDIFPERDVEENHSREAEENHPRVERSNSTATNTSLDSALSPLSPPLVLSPLEEPPSVTQLPSNLDPSKEITQLVTTQTSEDSSDWEKNLV